MGLPNPYRPIQDQVLLPGNEVQCLQSLSAECGRKLYVRIAVSLEGFVNGEPGTFDQPFTAVFIPEGKFPLHKLQDKPQLFLRPLFPAGLCYPA